MGYLPLFLNVQDALCLVVGGGQTAHRKAAMLLEAGARVVAVSLQFNEAFAEMQRQFSGALELRVGPYQSGELSHYRLVFAATDNSALNQTVAEDARRANLWVNVVDEPALCSALCGAVLQRGTLQAAFSTGGACPTLSVAMRDELAAQNPEWVGTFATVLGSLRAWLLERCPQMAQRKRILYQLSSPAIRNRHQGWKPKCYSHYCRQRQKNSCKNAASPPPTPDSRSLSSIRNS